MAGKVNPIQSYQEATNQLLQINSQRKNNLAEAKMQENLERAKTNTLAQAAQFVATTQPTGGAPVVSNATFNPATQNILGQYGLGKPRIQKTSSSSQQVTKENIVINNKNTTVTNNNVQIPSGYGGPVQGRPIQFQQQVDQGQLKFKTWLSNSLAQQNEVSAKRSREYEKRDSSLSKTANKLMRKLEETGKVIATTMNPKNMASTMSNQLRTLMMVLGFGYIAKNWPKILKRIKSIEDKVIEIKDKVVDFFSVGGGFVKILGGKDGETVLEAFKNLFLDKNDGLLAYVRQWLRNKFEERREAVRTLEKPDLAWNTGEGVGNNITRILGNVVGYLGDILGAILDPKSAAVKKVNAVAAKEEKKYQEDNQGILRDREKVTAYNNKSKKEAAGYVSSGDKAVVEGNYEGLKPGSLDRNGNLTNSPISTISQGNEVAKAILDSRKTGKLETSKVAVGLSRLKKASEENGNEGIPLSKKFLDSFLSPDEIKKLGLEDQSSRYRYIVRPKTKEEMVADLASISKDSKEIRELLTGAGMLLGNGGMPANIGGTLLGGATGFAIGEIAKILEKAGLPKYVIELKRSDKIDWKQGAAVVQGSKPEGIYEVTPDVLQKIIDKITGQKDLNVDLNSSDYMKAIEKSLITKNTPIGITKDIDIDKTYRASEMVDRNQAQMETKWENSRAHNGAEYTKEKTVDLANKTKNKVSQVFNKTNEQSQSSSEVFKDGSVNSGDLSKVVEATKRGLFYSNSSDKNKIGEKGMMSKNGHGYIPISKTKYMGKCTSGPATFYYEGSDGKIRLNGNWWNTGSPYSATATNIYKQGFKKVWSGSRDQGKTTEAIKATGFTPKPGDIMLNFVGGLKVSDSHKRWNGSNWVSTYSNKSEEYTGQSAHAQMYDGTQWISDKYQGNKCWPYGNAPGRLGSDSMQIWRYDSENSPIADKNTDNKQKIDNSSTTNTAESDPLTEQMMNSVSATSGKDVEIVESKALNTTDPLIEQMMNSVSATSGKDVEIVDKPITPEQITPESNLADKFPSAIPSEKNKTSGDNFTNKKEIKIPDYTVPLNMISADTRTIIEAYKLGTESIVQELTNLESIIKSSSSAKSNNTNATTPITAQDFTQSFFNKYAINS